MLLGYIVQADKTHGDVTESASRSTAINKELFAQIMGTLFDDEVIDAMEKYAIHCRDYDLSTEIVLTMRIDSHVIVA